jgi:hypothetical protein
MNITYTLWTNISSGFRRSYEHGDVIVRGYQGTIVADSIDAAAELLYRRHNSGDRPDGRIAPSMSIGDVIEFSTGAVSPTHIGFVPVTLVEAGKITDRAWRDVIDSTK